MVQNHAKSVSDYLLWVLYTHNNNDINNNSTYTYAETQSKPNTQVTLLCRYERFYKLLTSVLRHEERDTILTMLTIPSDPKHTWYILW